ncbi:phosphatase PAP2 family protein, partial [Singulisphaera rosea]
MQDPPPRDPRRLQADFWRAGIVLIVLGALIFAYGQAGKPTWVSRAGVLDRKVHDWVVSTRGNWPGLTSFFHAATRFGNPDIATVATLAMTAGLYVLWRRGVAGVRRSDAFFWLAVIVGGRFVCSALKELIRRERPPLGNRLIAETAFSFPSGHSVFASAFFTMLAILLLRIIPEARHRLRWLAAIACLPAAILVALSRVWLGVHYPT